MDAMAETKKAYFAHKEYCYSPDCPVRTRLLSAWTKAIEHESDRLSAILTRRLST